MNLLNNQKGHGQVPSGKDALKLLAILVTFPVSVPALLIIGKIKEKRKK